MLAVRNFENFSSQERTYAFSYMSFPITKTTRCATLHRNSARKTREDAEGVFETINRHAATSSREHFERCVSIGIPTGRKNRAK